MPGPVLRPQTLPRADRMNWAVGWRTDLCLAIALGAGILLLPCLPFVASSAGPVEPYKGLRETTRQYINLGAPDDLLRLQDALEKTEQEIARLKLGALRPEKEPQLSAMRDRLAESEALLRLVDSSAKEIPNRELDRLGAQERASLRTKLLGRIQALRETIAVLEKEIRFEQAEYLRSLETERKTLGGLLAVRREQLVGEYAKLSSCTVADRPCLARKLKTLCKLQPLFSVAERAPILMLQQETWDELGVGIGSLSSLCDYLRFDFAL